MLIVLCIGFVVTSFSFVKYWMVRGINFVSYSDMCMVSDFFCEMPKAWADTIDVKLYKMKKVDKPEDTLS